MLASSNGDSLWPNRSSFAASSAAFSPNGLYVATGSYEYMIPTNVFGAKLLDSSNGGVVRSFSGHKDFVRSVAFSPLGNLLAAGSWDGTVRLWSIEDGMPLQTINIAETNVSSVAFSPDAKYLIAGTFDRLARIYRLHDGQLVRVLAGHNNRVTVVGFSPDGTQALTASEDGTVLLWSLSDLISTDILMRIGMEGSKIRVSWSGEAKLQSADTVSGPYETIFGVTNFLLLDSFDSRFFRGVRE